MYSRSLCSCCLLTILKCVPSIGSPVMCRTKWPTTYTRYFALGMQLPPAPSRPFLSTWGAVMLVKKKKKKKKKNSPEGNCIATKDEKVDNPEVCPKCHAFLGPCLFSPLQMFVVPVLTTLTLSIHTCIYIS